MKISPVINNCFIKRPNPMQILKRMSFGEKDTFEKRVECKYYFCNENSPVCRENFPPDYTYKNLYGEYFLKPYYFLLHLESFKKGEGTKAIKKVVKESLENPNSQGRVILFSSNLKNGPYSAGFYYKLGFRFNYKPNNEILEDWLKKGGQKSSAPQIEGPMYLPKENIPHCLNY